MDLWELDFRYVPKDKNPSVQAQGVLLCIQTSTNRFFSHELERYVTRQDLAVKRPLIKTADKDHLSIVGITFAYEKGVGYGREGITTANPFRRDDIHAIAFNHGVSEGTVWHERRHARCEPEAVDTSSGIVVELDASRSIEVPLRFKLKIEERGSEELTKMYDFLFDILNVTWAGRVGHYAFCNPGDEHQLADNQDGYIYGWRQPDATYWRISASPQSGDPNWEEISWHDCAEVKGDES